MREHKIWTPFERDPFDTDLEDLDVPEEIGDTFLSQDSPEEDAETLSTHLPQVEWDELTPLALLTEALRDPTQTLRLANQRLHPLEIEYPGLKKLFGMAITHGFLLKTYRERLKHLSLFLFEDLEVKEDLEQTREEIRERIEKTLFKEFPSSLLEEIPTPFGKVCACPPEVATALSQKVKEVVEFLSLPPTKET